SVDSHSSRLLCRRNSGSPLSRYGCAMLSGHNPVEGSESEVLMSLRQRLIVFIVWTSFWLSACSTAPTPRRLAQDAVTAMGGVEKLQSIQTLTMKGGTGTRLRLGQ